MPLDTTDLIDEIPGLVRYARYLTGDLNSAEDLVQDTLERALRSADTFQGQSALRTWLHRVMHHRFIDLQRAKSADPVPDEVIGAEIERSWQDDDYTVDPQTVIARAADRDDLLDALVHLPAILRAAVILHDLEGLTSAEVAEISAVSLPAAKQRLRRGRAMIIDLLADEARRRASTGVPMRCWKARSRIGDYLDDELTAGERSALETHLSGCPTCPGLYAAVVGVTDAVGRLRDPDSVVPPEMAERLRITVQAQQRGSGGRSGR